MASFQQKKQQDEIQKANAPQVEEPKDSLDKGAQLDQGRVEAAIAQWGEELKVANRITLATSLTQAAIKLEFNKLILALGSDVERSMMERDRTEIAVVLREKTGYASLFIEIVVDPSLIPQREDKPYTMEDKLKVLSEKNPAMRRLQETFRTRILQ